MVASTSLLDTGGPVARLASQQPSRTPVWDLVPALTPLDVLVRFGRDELVVSPRGEIDLVTAPDLEAVVESVLDADAGRARRRLLLDLAEVDFLGAEGLKLISRLAGQLGASSTEFVVRSPSAVTRRLLDMFGLGCLVEAARPRTRARAVDAERHGAAVNAPLGPSLDEVREASSRAREHTVDAALAVVVALAAATVASADSVSITLRRRGRLTTVATSDEAARRLDEEQYSVGHGPCVHAAATGEQAHVSSAGDGNPWPAFLLVAARAGMATVLSTPLTVDAEPVGALNMYSHTAGAFGRDQRELAALISSQAAGVLGGACDDLTGTEHVRRLQSALQSRETIAQAQGILMERDRISADDAAGHLRRTARQADIPLRDVAASTIAAAASAADPSTGG